MLNCNQIEEADIQKKSFSPIVMTTSMRIADLCHFESNRTASFKESIYLLYTFYIPFIYLIVLSYEIDNVTDVYSENSETGKNDIENENYVQCNGLEKTSPLEERRGVPRLWGKTKGKRLALLRPLRQRNKSKILGPQFCWRDVIDLDKHYFRKYYKS